MKINLIEYFRETVARVPDKQAVIEGDTAIDFKTLDARAKKMACQIVKTIHSINEPISVFLPKSIDAVVSDLAITYSGNIYMNLDIKTPAERIKNILETIRPKVIITNQSLLKNIEQIVPQDVLIIDIDSISEYTEEDDSFLLKRLEWLIDTDPYCIINTSGSTGTPKGVVLNHKSFFDFTEWSVSTLNIGNNEIIGSLSPIIFDIYSHELCMLMAKGSTIVLIPESLSAFPFKILEILKKENVTYLFWVPTIMVNIANMDLLNKIALPCLAKIWFAGEVLPTKQYNYWHACLPKTMFVNLYGPIEITLDCTYYVVDRDFEDNEPLPIGKACRNTSILILNEGNAPCGINEEGELCVRGTSLAMGYYNNPEKTSLVFIQNPLNTKYPELIYRTGDMVVMTDKGEIVFKGRKDTLVKHLGYRIELGEIEHTVVNALKLVANGCVIYNHENKEITLIYESTDEISVGDFRKRIGANLPKYMIPTKYVRVDKMPMNTNGKIDRLSLAKKING